jgi:spore coat protein CotF
MILASHELHDLHELIMSCVNSVTNMGLFLNQVQDPELKAILERHFPLHIQDYNMKVEFVQQMEGSQQVLPVPDINAILQSYSQPPMNQFPPVTPRTDAVSLNDREIATAYLLTLKRAGREYAWSVMETSHPQIRQFLESAFLMSSHHAYDVWQYMVNKGYYPIEPATPTSLSTVSSIYNLVQPQ